MKKVLLFLAVAFSATAMAQVASYNFQASNAPYVPLSSSATDDLSNIGDEVNSSSPIPLGFTFTYDNVAYTSVVATSNGVLSFNPAATPNYLNISLANPRAALTPLIAPLWDDLYSESSYAKARYETSGSAPNRVFTYEWYGYQWAYDAPGDSVVAFQVKLYETSNEIELHYKWLNHAALSFPGASIGLSDGSTYLSVDSIGTSNLMVSSSTVGNIDTVVEGEVYRFSPPSCLAPTFTGFTNAGGQSVDLHWTGSGADDVYINWGPLGFVQGNPSSDFDTSATGSTTINGLVLDTTYQFYLQRNCGPGGTSIWIGPYSIYLPSCATQTLPYTEDFNVDLGCFGFIDGGTSTDSWFQTLDYNSNTLNGTGFAFIDDDVVGAAVGSYEILLSPVIDASNISGNLILEFIHFYEDVFDNDSGTVQVYDGTQWVNLVVFGSSTGGWGAPDRQEIDITAYANANLQVRFIYDDGGAYAWFWAVDSLSIQDVQCSDPVFSSSPNVTPNSIDLSWLGTASDSVYINWGLEGFQQGIVGSSYDTSVTGGVTISGLSPNTGYDFYIQRNCGVGGVTTWIGPLTVYTSCITQTLPYLEDFNVNLGCFSVVDGGTTTDSWFQTPDYNSSTLDGTGFAFIDDDIVGPAVDSYEILVSPVIDASSVSGNLILEFDHFYEDVIDNDSGTVQVYDGTQWVNLVVFGSSIGGWSNPDHQRLDITAYANANLQVRFIYDDGGAYAWFWAVDNVSIEDVLCNIPTFGSFTNITPNSVDLNWLGTASDSVYINWGPEGFTQGSATSGFDTSATGGTTVGGLMPGTSYDFYLQRDCGSNGVANWVGPFTVITQCQTFTAPYSQNFDGTTAPDIDNCWGVIAPPGGFIQTVTSTDHGEPIPSLPNTLEINDVPAGAIGMLISPEFTDLPSGANWIKVKISYEGGGQSAFDTLFFGTMASQIDTFSFVPYDTIVMGNTAGEFIETVILLDNTTLIGSNTYVAFSYKVAGGGYEFFLDDFIYEPAPACLPPLPNTLGAVDITGTGADLFWGAGSQGQKTYIEVGIPGFTPGMGNSVVLDSVPGSQDTITVGGLMPETLYEFYIQDSCLTGGLSPWVGPFTFITGCAFSPVTLPFTEDFESYSGPISVDTTFICGGTFSWSFERSSPTSGDLFFDYTASQGPPPPFAGLQSAGIQTTSGNPAYMVLTVDMSNYASMSQAVELSFNFADHGDEADPEDRVWARGSTSDPWVEIYDWSVLNSSSWEFVSISLSTALTAASQTFSSSTQIRWGQQDDSDLSGGDGLGLDDVSLVEVACPKPTNLSGKDISDTSVTLTWSGNSGNIDYEVWFGPQGFYQGTQTAGAIRVFTGGADSLMVDTLSNLTCYEYAVRAICAPGDTSEWEGAFSFCTLCPSGKRSIPYTEDFNAGFGCFTVVDSSADPSTWQHLPAGGSANAAGDLDGTPFIIVDSDEAGSVDMDEYAYSPVIDASTLASGDSLYVEFHQYFRVYTLGNIEKADVEVWDGVSWRPIHSQDQNTGDLGDWSFPDTVRINITQYAHADLQVRFRYYDANFDWWWAIDNFSVYSINPGCPSPTALAATANISCTDAEVSWTSNSGGSIIEYGPQNFVPGNGTFTGIVTSPHVITGLAPGTIYDVYVADTCGSDTSNYSVVLSITTATTPLPVASFTITDTTYTPTTQTLDLDASGSTNAMGYSWDFGNGNTGSGVTVSETYNLPNGSFSITLTVDNGCGTDDTTITINTNIGLNENALERSLDIYPIPASEVINISFNTIDEQEAVIRIMDIRGKEVIRLTENDIDNHYYEGSIDISDLPLAVYMLEIDNGGVIATRKIVKQ